MKRKKLFGFCLLLFCLCSLLVLAGCTSESGGYTLSGRETSQQPDAVEPIVSTDRSHIEVTTEATTVTTARPEVVATGTTAPAVTTLPPVTEAPKEYYTVKFVDSDGYTTISLQTVTEGEDAVEPAMPAQRGELYFRGWNRDFTHVQRSMTVTAIYTKEIFTVRFFDMNGTLLSTELVRYGEDATAPEIEDHADYYFDGWSKLFDNVQADLDVYALYHAAPARETVTLEEAYAYLPHADNTLSLPEETYYRRTPSAAFTLGEREYAASRALYGNFCDTFALEGYAFDGISGKLFLLGSPEADDSYAYSLRLTLFGDEGEVLYRKLLTRVGNSVDFDVSLTDVKELTIVLEPMADGYAYYDEAVFIGGILDGALYKEN